MFWVWYEPALLVLRWTRIPSAWCVNFPNGMYRKRKQQTDCSVYHSCVQIQTSLPASFCYFDLITTLHLHVLSWVTLMFLKHLEAWIVQTKQKSSSQMHKCNCYPYLNPFYSPCVSRFIHVSVWGGGGVRAALRTCIVTSRSSTITSFVRKSAPIVALYWLLNFLFTYWFIREVFPTLHTHTHTRSRESGSESFEHFYV